MESRDYFIIAALLAAGTVLRFILVLPGEPFTPNVLVAFYGLAIVALSLSFGQSLVIGLISGIIASLIGSFVVNPAFLISEPVGAVVCLGVFLSLHSSRGSAGISVFVATLASGVVNSALLLSFAGASMVGESSEAAAFVLTILPIALLTATANGLFAGLLFPWIRAFRNPGKDRQVLFSSP
jgi:hypothetical protein